MTFSLPNECFSELFSSLDRKSLYNCLFVNRFYCKLSIPIIWRDPFIMSFYDNKFTLINTLLACLNEDEVSSLIPCAINFNNQPSLFEYGHFVRAIDHGNFVSHLIGWLKLSSERDSTDDQDFRIRKLINVMYHMIMRQGSNLQEFIVTESHGNYIDLPKFSVFATYEPGITNLRSFIIDIDFGFRDKFPNTIEFLSMVSNFCNGIDNCELGINDGFSCTALLDFIKLQPLERIMMYINDSIDSGNVKKIIYALKFRSETLKELSFDCLNFRGIDLSFISKLEYLEHLAFQDCSCFTFYEGLSKKKLHLKELIVWRCDTKMDMINSLCSEALVKLSLSNTTPEIVKLVKESCPNISHLRMKGPELYLDSVILPICELSSLRNLQIYADNLFEDRDIPVRILGDYLTSVEYLVLSFHIELSSFVYFTNNCKAKLKKWIIVLDDKSLRKDYLICVNNFKKVHNSLKVLGIDQYEIDGWTDEELEIIDSLKNQGVDIVSSYGVDDEFSILLKFLV